MADERLQRWAQDRVPDLLRRAEEEALAEARALLRDALLDAALAESPGAPGTERPSAPEPHRATPHPPASAPPPPAPAGEAQWLYAVGRAEVTESPPSATGVRGAPVRLVREGELTALVSPVPLPEFGEEELKESLNDMRWLEDVARAHERVVDAAFEQGPVVPLRLCSIYATPERVRDLLRDEREHFGELLGVVEGKQEWSVKLFADPSLLAAAAGPEGADGPGGEADPGAGGAAYLARRRSDRAAREAADRLAGELAEEVHARLQDWAVDAVVGRPQNPELSGHSGEMLLNGSYLVEEDGAEPFAALVAELRTRYEGVGATLELSGPWPPYNFIGGEA